MCNPAQIQRYVGRISGPLLDRIDLHVNVPAVKLEDLRVRPSGEPSATIRERVQGAREIQSKRYADHPGIYCNAQMTSRDLRTFCVLDPSAEQMLENAMRGLNLSARAYDRILKTARTIADLDNSEQIESNHVSEAVNYRTLDRTLVL